MKKLLMICAVVGSLCACAQTQQSQVQQSENTGQAIGMANPAFVYCVSQGGKIEPKRDAQGAEYSLCHLPNGKVVEEWEYFRADHK